jgi:hypothetical protein
VIKDLHIGHLMVLNQFGSIPHDLAMENIRLTATKVVPNLKQMWPEREDKWWPRALRSPQRPGPIYARDTAVAR